jgi:hypothetical protein
MKLRDTQFQEDGDTAYSIVDHEDSQEFLADVSLSPGSDHNLPRPKGYIKHRRVGYRIRFDIPDLENKSDDQDNNDDECDSEDKGVSSTIEAATVSSRGGGLSGISGFNRSNDWVSWRESETENNKINRGDDNIIIDDGGDSTSESESHCTTTADEQPKSELSGGGGYDPPDVWVTPIKSKDGSRKWIAKRVWDIEDKDDEEPEYEIDHWYLMNGVRGLMGIPEEMGMTSDEWQVIIDESDPWEMAANKDSTPNLPTRKRDDHFRAQLFVKMVVDVDGQCEESTSSSVLLDEENCHEQLEHITDISHYEENSLTDASTILDSESDASFISFV